jgi:hypothetical protein
VVNGGSDELEISRHQAGNSIGDAGLAQPEQIIKRWAAMWRSIILSSLTKTLYPYCRFMRVLNLRDLGNLLEDPKFRGNIDR